jgi:hypothetical protein
MGDMGNGYMNFDINSDGKNIIGTLRARLKDKIKGMPITVAARSTA